VEVEVLGKGRGYDEVGCGGVKEEALNDTDFRGPFREVDVFER
jgi:hypothetical protein